MPSHSSTAATGRESLVAEPDSEPIHGWFGLSYANYLVVPRSVLQSMPDEWQARFVGMMGELRASFGHLDWPTYDVRVYARAAEFGVYVKCDECEGEGEMAFGESCIYCAGEGEEYEARYETAEEVGFKSDPIPHYNRGRTRLEPRNA